MRVCDVTVSATVPAGCAAYRITEIPRRPEPSAAGRRAAGRRRSGPAAAGGRAGGRVPRGHREGGRDGRVRLGAGGGGRAGADDRGRGRARRQRRPGRAARCCWRCPAGRAARRCRRPSWPGCSGSSDCWREVAGISDGLLALPGEPGAPGAAGGSGASGRAGLSLDEGLLGSWTGPFGWLVTAEPVTPAELRALAEEVGLRQRIAEGSADRFPERAAQARAAQGTARRAAARPVDRVLADHDRGGRRGTSRARPGSPGCCARRPTWRGCRTR